MSHSHCIHFFPRMTRRVFLIHAWSTARHSPVFLCHSSMCVDGFSWRVFTWIYFGAFQHLWPLENCAVCLVYGQLLRKSHATVRDFSEIQMWLSDAKFWSSWNISLNIFENVLHFWVIFFCFLMFISHDYFVVQIWWVLFQVFIFFKFLFRYMKD